MSDSSFNLQFRSGNAKVLSSGVLLTFDNTLELEWDSGTEPISTFNLKIIFEHKPSGAKFINVTQNDRNGVEVILQPTLNRGLPFGLSPLPIGKFNNKALYIVMSLASTSSERSTFLFTYTLYVLDAVDADEYELRRDDERETRG